MEEAKEKQVTALTEENKQEALKKRSLNEQIRRQGKNE
jgi:hypothetical protein